MTTRTGQSAPARLYVAVNNGGLGGGELMALEVAREARRHGIPCAVVAPARPAGVLAAAAAEGMPCVRIHAAGRRGYLLRLAWWRATHREGLLWCAGLVPAVAALGDRRKVVHLHKLPEGWAQRVLTRAARLGARLTLVPSDFLARHVPGAEVLPNWTLGPDPADLADRPSQRPADRPPTIGYLGRLTSAKGVLDLLAAVEHLADSTRPDVRLVVAGEPLYGGDADEVCRALDAAGDRVDQLGRVNAPADLFARIDLLVVPSRAPESFGLVVAEALAASMPVVVTDAGALPEILPPGHGFVARAGNPSDLAATIDRALTALADPPARTSLTAAGRRRWETSYAPGVGRGRLSTILSRFDESRGGAS
ncbi:MAG: glycosyltransferase [Actinomycetales bacterium]|nr:glycosyltransferase [Actinomycetales bacterium]